MDQPVKGPDGMRAAEGKLLRAEKRATRFGSPNTARPDGVYSSAEITE
jgi:hypothetical protein